MTTAEFKSELLKLDTAGQILEYFSIVLEVAVEFASQGKLTPEQLRQYRKEFQAKEIADIDAELASLPQ